MVTWDEFKKVAVGKEWNVKQGEAYWNKDDIRAKVQIKVPSNSLEPTRERIHLANLNTNIQFQAYFISDEPVTYLEAQQFAWAWVDLWGEQKPIEISDGPPPNFEFPAQLDFSPLLKESFKKYKISITQLAPLWGQPRYYFGDIEIELNAGPRQNNDPKVKYQQDWVENNLNCPFCLHTNWALTYAVKLNKPEELWYDPEKFFYILLCPKCERAVEVIPRELI